MIGYSFEKKLVVTEPRVEDFPRSWRLRLAWKILLFDYVLLAAASWGILSNGADLATANGRHLLAGALANLALVAMGIVVTVTAFRQGKRWAWFANLIPLLYGIPMIILDGYYVGFWTVAVVPLALGFLLLVLALMLPADIFWRSKATGS
jgi:hypothetical protein